LTISTQPKTDELTPRGPHLLVFDDALSLARAAAEYVAALSAEPMIERQRFTLALSGGSTPQALFRILAQPPYALSLPWPDTHIFWADERCVLPNDEGSNYKHAYDLWLRHVPISKTHLHRIKGELGPQAAAQDYVAQLRELPEIEHDWPTFDLALLGMGDDGHTASLFPGPIPIAELTEPVLPVTAHYQDRPANRVTLTPVVFNTARNIIFLVTGAGKAEALAAVLRGKADPARWPASRIRPKRGMVTWMVDRAAASKLP
jgi:6-phosphogluconolactonase